VGDPRQRGWTEEFKREAVRLLSTSEQTVGEVAADRGVGKSDALAATVPGSGPAGRAASGCGAELARLRRENGILRQERDLPEKATAFFTKETSR
jgi:transposase